MLPPSAFNNDFFCTTIIGSVNIKNVCIMIVVRNKNSDVIRGDLTFKSLITIRRSTLFKISARTISKAPYIRRDGYLLRAFFISAFAFKGRFAFMFLYIFIAIAVKKTPITI